MKKKNYTIPAAVIAAVLTAVLFVARKLNRNKTPDNNAE